MGDEEEMNELNIEDYSDLDEEEEMGGYQPDYVSSELGEEEIAEEEEVMHENPADKEVEIDLEEIKKEINNNIHTTLAKYFK
jgi:pyruvate/oxaloacetate carboxyltransferase